MAKKRSIRKTEPTLGMDFGGTSRMQTVKAFYLIFFALLLQFINSSFPLSLVSIDNIFSVFTHIGNQLVARKA